MYFAIWYLKIITHYRILNHSFFNLFTDIHVNVLIFFKAHNNQLNQYYLFFYKKKNFKNSLGHGSGWVGSGWLEKNISWVTSQSVFTSGQKIWFWLGIFQVGLGRLRKLWFVLPFLSKTGYIPSINEYLEAGMTSIATHTIVLLASCFLKPRLLDSKLKTVQYGKHYKTWWESKNIKGFIACSS